MYNKSRGSDLISLEKSFIRLLISQGIMEFGDNFRLLAVTMLLLKLTGSGLAAGFSLVMTPIMGIILSPLAGVLGDGLEGKKLLSILYLLQGALVTIFINGCQLGIVYVVLILFAGIQIIQDPVYKKMVRNSLQNSDIMVGNSLSIGVSGFSNLLAPILGGISIQLWGMDKTLIGSSLGYITSSLIVLSIDSEMDPAKKTIYKNNLSIGNSDSIIGRFRNEMREGIGYFWQMYSIREMAIAGCILSFGTASVSFAFYSLAFDIMGVTASGWGFILSVFFSTRLLAMFISIIINRDKGIKTSYNIYIPLFFTCLSWLLYGFVEEFSYIIFILVLEGTSHFLFEIFLWTRLQIISKRTFIARIVGINNIMINGARIMGIILAYIIIQFYDIQVVFIVNGILIFIYAFYKVCS